jgi:hypothetical protein
MAYTFVIPQQGLNLLAKLLAGGQKLTLSRIMVGSGKLPEDVEWSEISELVQPVAEGTSTIPVVKNSTCSFVVEYRSDLNGGLEEGFYLNEFGVYAVDPDLGEILLYYGNLRDYPQYVSAYYEACDDGSGEGAVIPSGAVDTQRFAVVIGLTTDLKVDILYQAGAWMTAEDVDDYFRNVALPIASAEAQRLIDLHNEDPNAHPALRSQDEVMSGQIQQIFDMLTGDIVGNQFKLTFGTLDGLEVTGVWDKENSRMAF